MHAIEGGKGKGLTLIRVRVLREVRDKTKPFLSKNEAWCSQHSVVVVAGTWRANGQSWKDTYNEPKVVEG